MSRRLTGTTLLLLIGELLVSLSTAADDLRESRRAFLAELSDALLDAPHPMPEEHGCWQGVVLAPPGAALSPTTTNFEAFGSSEQNNSQILGDSYLFDRALLVRNGLAYPKVKRLSEAWEQVLRLSMPKTPLSLDAFLETEHDAAKWLFKVPDAVDAARGVTFSREPADSYLRYREYQLTYSFLVASRIGGQSKNEPWRLHPRLGGYGTYDEAEAGVLRDWQIYGFRDEVKHALAKFEAVVQPGPWDAWSRALEAYRSNLRFVNSSQQLPQTILSPSPDEWLRMGSWRHINSRDGGAIFACEIACVHIVREWFRCDELVDGHLQIDPEATEKDLLLSDGTAPDLLNYPTGILSVIPEQLILVRNIRLQSSGEASAHPLSVLAERERISLLGYVVRVLPKMVITSKPATAGG